MAEYIEKNEFFDAIRAEFYDRIPTGSEVISRLLKFPAADVRENVIRTQADKLRTMSDEELAEWISCNCTGDGYGNSEAEWLDLLKSPVEVESADRSN